MRRTTLVVAAYALAWFLLNVFRAAIPILLPELRRLYDVGFTDAGIVFAVLFAGVALMQFPSGVIADIVGDRWVVLASLVGSSALVASFAFATTVPALLVVAFGLGITVGGFRSVAISAVSKAVGDEPRSRALGLMAAGNPLGNLVGPVLAAAGIIALGVVGMPLVLGTAGLAWAAGVGLVLFRDDRNVDASGDADPPETGEPSDLIRATIGRRVGRTLGVLASPSGVLIVLASVAFAVTWQGMFSFLPTYLVEVRRIALAGSGVVTGITFGVGMVGNVAGGRVADRLGEGFTLFGGFLLAGGSLGGLLIAGELQLAVASLVGLGLGLGVITPARDAFISGLSGPDDRGSVVGGVRTVYILLASGGTALAGVTIDRVGFDGAFLLFAGILGIGAVAALVLVAVVPDRDPSAP